MSAFDPKDVAQGGGGAKAKTKTKGKARSKPKSRRLQEVGNTEFENLLFDLAMSIGMRNVAWRTPGADGGRDIEGETTDVDFAGFSVVRKWYIECKRYARSVDWPTIYSKIPYADNHRANYLLLATTSQFSPAAITEVNRWNCAGRAPIIRLWPRHEIEMRLKQFPDLRLKYGFIDAFDGPGRTIVTLALALSKTVSSHHSKLVFRGADADPMLEASQAIADLLSIRMQDIERAGRIRPSFPVSTRHVATNCTFTKDTVDIDGPGLRAVLTYLVALTQKTLRVEVVDPRYCRIMDGTSLKDVLVRYWDVFIAISVWSDLELDVGPNYIGLRQRL